MTDVTSLLTRIDAEFHTADEKVATLHVDRIHDYHEQQTKGQLAVAGGPLSSKPTWWKARGHSITSALFLGGATTVATAGEEK